MYFQINLLKLKRWHLGKSLSSDAELACPPLRDWESLLLGNHQWWQLPGAPGSKMGRPASGPESFTVSWAGNPLPSWDTASSSVKWAYPTYLFWNNGCKSSLEMQKIIIILTWCSRYWSIQWKTKNAWFRAGCLSSCSWNSVSDLGLSDRAHCISPHISPVKRASEPFRTPLGLGLGQEWGWRKGGRGRFLGRRQGNSRFYCGSSEPQVLWSLSWLLLRWLHHLLIFPAVTGPWGPTSYLDSHCQ